MSSSGLTFPLPLERPSPSPTPPVFGNLLFTGDGEGGNPEGARLGVGGAHWPDVAGGVEAEATRDVGERRESKPVENDDDRPCVGRRRWEPGGWFSDDVMSILPPPMTDRFRSAARTELSFWCCSGVA